MTELVTLILGEDRIEASRENLISKSEYFASLFSPNFRDSLSNEHRINYDIDAVTLRTFISWTSDRLPFDRLPSSVKNCDRVKPSLANYIGKSADFDNLLQLLQLGVIFAAESLVEDLTDLIICHWLIPDTSIQVWLLARELGLATLSDFAKLVCIQRLSDLPEILLMELTGEDFIDIVGNVRVAAKQEFLIGLAKRWIELNVAPGESNAFESRYPFTLIGKRIKVADFERMYAEQQWELNIQCIVGRKNTKDNEEQLCIYCWNGATFSELIDLPSFATVSTNNLIDMRVVGRGFDIYLVGGKWKKDTGQFKKEIWRYSLISKTWNYATSLPKPRQHVAVGFVKEKVFLMGDVDKDCRKLSLIDIYKLRTDFDVVKPPKMWGVEDNEYPESDRVGRCLLSFDNQVANGPYLVGFAHEDDMMYVKIVRVTNSNSVEIDIVYEEERNDIRDLCPDDYIGCFNIFRPESLNELFILTDNS